MPTTYKPGTRLTWRTMNGTRNGRVLSYNINGGFYVVRPDGLTPRNAATTARVFPQDITRTYNR